MNIFNQREVIQGQTVSYEFDPLSGDFDTGLEESDSNYEDDDIEVYVLCS